MTSIHRLAVIDPFLQITVIASLVAIIAIAGFQCLRRWRKRHGRRWTEAWIIY